jgi:hypothetical protein
MPLLWENQSGSVELELAPGAHEAIWTAHGALCLDSPRLVERSEVSCSLPSCSEFSLDDGEWATWVIAD